MAVAALVLASPGAQIATYRDVPFYPACDNETLSYEGKLWFSFRPANPDEFPTPTADDVGTLTVYEDGSAYWVSNSGDLDRWLTNHELAYRWAR